MNTSLSGLLNKNSLPKWTLVGALLAILLVVALSWILSAPGMRIILVLCLTSLSGAVLARFIYAFKSHRSLKHKIWLGFLTLFSALLVFLSIQWKAVSDKGGEIRQEPFRIAGNLYYVGTKEMTSFLLTSSQGHVLIDGGYPGNTEMIIKNIGILGFKITDVKILLNSHAHVDHAGGLAALQEASGAELWISEPDAELIESGGAGKRNIGLMNFLIYTGLAKYPAPHIDHQFKDGTKIVLGPIELTAHITPGHTPGSTTWTFPVTDGNRKLLAVNTSSLTVIPSSLFGEKYDAELQREFKLSFKKLRSIPTDIFLGPHASFFDMAAKLKQRDTVADPVAPFIDREGYSKYIDKSEEKFRKALLDK
ncbi:subclass B3 metallo-beta-lactamase [Pontibacter ruber]|uniref:Subclass B3 metallo-beta-lactamase n=1 Tax=Pontibacter ruber TaxID=1343895 RepID=A0ABW5CTZ5_9BACT|nr:subclass B3 metallo-beta-lactamase [Pontibacter ruber]